MGILLLLASDSTKYVNIQQHPWEQEKNELLERKKKKKVWSASLGAVIHVVVAKKRATQTGDIIVIIIIFFFSLRGLMVLRDVVVSISWLYISSEVPFLILMRRQ